jgi:MFS family permease
MTLNFWRMCTANLLLFISVYMLFPLLPFVMGEQLGVSVGQAGSMFLVFAVAMFAVGPFHAYLVDEYKRKHVLLYSALIMLAAVLGYAFVEGVDFGICGFLLIACIVLLLIIGCVVFKAWRIANENPVDSIKSE